MLPVYCAFGDSQLEISTSVNEAQLLNAQEKLVTLDVFQLLTPSTLFRLVQFLNI